MVLIWLTTQINKFELNRSVIKKSFMLLLRFLPKQITRSDHVTVSFHAFSIKVATFSAVCWGLNIIVYPDSIKIESRLINLRIGFSTRMEESKGHICLTLMK